MLRARQPKRWLAWGLWVSVGSVGLAGGVLLWRMSRPTVLPAAVDPAIPYAAVRAALETARAEVVAAPYSADAWGHLGMVQSAHELVDAARVSWRRACELDPEDFRWPYLLGCSYPAGDERVALPLIARAASLGPGQEAIQCRWAELQLAGGERQPAIKTLETWVAREPGSGRGWLRLAQARASEGDWPRARDALQRALAAAPDRSEVRDEAARIGRRTGQPLALPELRGPAIAGWPDPLREAVRAQRQDPFWRLELALAAEKRGDLNAARAVFARLVEEHPDEPLFAVAHVRRLLADRDRSAARSALAQALLGAPGHPELLALRGTLALLDEDWPAAITDYRAALAVEPDRVAARQDLAFALEQTGAVDESLAEYTLVIRDDPAASVARLRGAKLLLARGATEQARAWLAEIPETAPEAKAARQLLGPANQREHK